MDMLHIINKRPWTESSASICNKNSKEIQPWHFDKFKHEKFGSEHYLNEEDKTKEDGSSPAAMPAVDSLGERPSEQFLQPPPLAEPGRSIWNQARRSINWLTGRRPKGVHTAVHGEASDGVGDGERGADDLAAAEHVLTE